MAWRRACLVRWSLRVKRLEQSGQGTGMPLWSLLPSPDELVPISSAALARPLLRPGEERKAGGGAVAISTTVCTAVAEAVVVVVAVGLLLAGDGGVHVSSSFF